MSTGESLLPEPTAEFLAAVLDLSDESIITVDLAGKVITWNAAAARFYECSPAQAIGKTIAELKFPSDLTLLQDRLKEPANGAGEFFGVIRITRDSQELKVALSITLLRNRRGEPIGASARSRDISAQGLAEKQQQETSRQLQMVIENAREYAIISLDLDRVVTSWNSGAEAILGYAQDEIVGQSADIIFTPEDRAAGTPAREALIAAAERRASDERWHVRKDGTRFWGSGLMMAMHDGDKKLVGLLKIFRDQTAEVEAKRALEESLLETEQARTEAEAAIRMKDRFFALISHELRTPLTPIVMALETLSRNKDLPPAHHAILAMIKRNVQIEARFIDDLLDVTRIAHGKLELALESLDVHDMISQALEVARPDLLGKNQTVTLSLEAADCRIEGDPARLQQIFWNLLKNASKFTPEGGAIQVRSRLREDPADGKWLVVEIDDTGIGFEPHIAEKIFEAFAQADSSITRNYGGLGLGLAISKAAVEAHDGRLSAHSDGPGHGAIFLVELPLSSRTKAG
jgi:two-component system CheB/CheR fusion protein